MDADQYEKQRARIKIYFDQDPIRFKWVGAVGSGGSGICSAVTEYLTNDTERKLVIKRAIPGERDTLLAEIDRLAVSPPQGDIYGIHLNIFSKYKVESTSCRRERYLTIPLIELYRWAY